MTKCIIDSYENALRVLEPLKAKLLKEFNRSKSSHPKKIKCSTFSQNFSPSSNSAIQKSFDQELQTLCINNNVAQKNPIQQKMVKINASRSTHTVPTKVLSMIHSNLNTDTSPSAVNDTVQRDVDVHSTAVAQTPRTVQINALRSTSTVTAQTLTISQSNLNQSINAPTAVIDTVQQNVTNSAVPTPVLEIQVCEDENELQIHSTPITFAVTEDSANICQEFQELLNMPSLNDKTSLSHEANNLLINLKDNTYKNNSESSGIENTGLGSDYHNNIIKKDKSIQVDMNAGM